jgi:hypothetical protein
MRTCLKCTCTKFEADLTMARGEAGVHAVREAEGATRKGAKEKNATWGDRSALSCVSSAVRCFDHVFLFPRQQRVRGRALIARCCWVLAPAMPVAGGCCVFGGAFVLVGNSRGS